MKKYKRRSYKSKREEFTNRPIKDRYFTKEDVFVSRLASILMCPKSQVKATFAKRPVTTIRLNKLKGDVKDTKEKLINKGYDLQEIPFAENVYFVKNKNKSEASQNQEYNDGKFYIQNLSSIIAVLVLNPKEGETILDMCAAPGSKSTYIADITNGKANILANDSDVKRFGDLQSVIKQFGTPSIKATLSDAREFGKKYPVYFDNVLLDAPCSGEGLIYFNGQRPLRYWSMNKVKKCIYTQKELIVSAFKTLKHGHSMVYSTCTLEPEENEGVVTHLLSQFSNAKVEKIDLIDSEEFADFKHLVRPGIKKWSGNTYNKEVTKTMRIIPCGKMMGFYIAKIRKE
ncbi:RsmB/NOP family class I SAM-dependent RNA methyltransferase [bacterium]|nr:RsmB/NOP family class I SAM-dependent RNA methyltransferase [bacterium]